jgi:hypothetical protein
MAPRPLLHPRPWPCPATSIPSTAPRPSLFMSPIPSPTQNMVNPMEQAHDSASPAFEPVNTQQSGRRTPGVGRSQSGPDLSKGPPAMTEWRPPPCLGTPHVQALFSVSGHRPIARESNLRMDSPYFASDATQRTMDSFLMTTVWYLPWPGMSGYSDEHSTADREHQSRIYQAFRKRGWKVFVAATCRRGDTILLK